MTVYAPQRSRILGASLLLFFVALGLTSYSAKNPWLGRGASSLGMSLLQPVQSLMAFVTGGVSGLWTGYVALQNVANENQSLKTRLSSLETEYSKLVEYQHENERLKSLLKVRQANQFAAVVGRVVAHDPTRWAHTVTLDVGVFDGVSQGMPVVDGKGVVGQVVSVGPHSSRVLLLTDSSSGVDALVQDTRARGLVEGGAGDQLRWDFVLSETEVAVGSRVVTSGKDGVFPKGLLLGVVSDIVKTSGRLFQRITITPAVDFTKLETVLVVKGEQK